MSLLLSDPVARGSLLLLDSSASSQVHQSSTVVVTTVTSVLGLYLRIGICFLCRLKGIESI